VYISTCLHQCSLKFTASCCCRFATLHRYLLQLPCLSSFVSALGVLCGFVDLGTAGEPVSQSVYCLATGWTTGRSRFDPGQRRKNFSSNLCVHTSSEAYPASCIVGTRVPFPGTKAQPGRDADHSPPYSAEVENEYELYILSPQAPAWRVVEQL
jgi:hypothetical protein